MNFFLGMGLTLLLAGCWDQPEHILDDDAVARAPLGDTAVNDSSGIDSDEPESDASGQTRNGLLTEEWKGFGLPCQVDDDCGGYPASEKRCIHDVMGIVTVPGGICTACCDTPGMDVCGPGVDCVGVDTMYLVCLDRCRTDADCRNTTDYACRSIYYIDHLFPDNYCLPISDYVLSEGDESGDSLSCPWPW